MVNAAALELRREDLDVARTVWEVEAVVLPLELRRDDEGVSTGAGAAGVEVVEMADDEVDVKEEASEVELVVSTLTLELS